MNRNITRTGLIVLALLLISAVGVIATETTWRHSGFEIWGYDINGSNIYNITEIRKIEFGWNASVPAVSEPSRAVMYYNDNEKRIRYSINGAAYDDIVNNATVDPYRVNSSNITGKLTALVVSNENVTSRSDFKFYQGTYYTSNNGTIPFVSGAAGAAVTSYSIPSSQKNGNWSFYLRKNTSLILRIIFTDPTETEGAGDGYIYADATPTFNWRASASEATQDMVWAYPLLNDGNWHWLDISNNSGVWKVHLDDIEIGNATNPVMTAAPAYTIIRDEAGINRMDYAYVIFKNITPARPKRFDTTYINGNSIQVIVTAWFNTTAAQQKATLTATVGTNKTSIGTIKGIAGLENEMQLSFYVPANTVYTVNANSTSYTGGIVTLRKWQEVTMP